MTEIPISIEGLSAPEKRMLLAQLLQKQSERGNTFPMSYGQKGLWLLHQLEPRNPAYNIAFPSRLLSRLDVPALQQTFATLVERHPSLRTTFAERDGELVQCVHDSMPITMQQIDATSWTDAELQTHLKNAATEPFSLAEGPLLRVCLFTRSPDDHIFLAVVHHIAVDFWSLVVLLTEIRELYPAARAGREPRLPPASSNYADFVQWQRGMLASAAGERIAAYWKQQLAGTAHVLELPTDQQRSLQFSHRAGVVPCRLTDELSSGVSGLAAREKVTVYSVLMAAFQVLLSRHTGQRDFLIGTPFVGRSRPGFEQTVGYFVNMLPIRAKLDGDPTFRQLLQQVGVTTLEALEYQDYPFPSIVDQLNVARDSSRPPLVQVSFTLERSHRQEEVGRGRFLFPGSEAHLDAGGLIEEPFYVEPQTCRHELEMILEQSEGAINGMLCYCADLFDKQTIERMAERFEILLRSAVSNPDCPLSQLQWYDVAEHARVVGQWNQTTVDFPSKVCLHELFQQQAIRTPDAIAVTFGLQEVSYRQLDTWANQLAHQLVARGVEPGDLVALCLDRSPEIIALILAILKAGGVCVPLDPKSPPGRLRVILADTNPVLAIGQEADASRLRAATDATVIAARELHDSILQDNDPPETDSEPPRLSTRPRDLAYVIYTSGSTGQPKGVMVSHRAICNTLQWRARDLPVDSSDCVLMVLPCFFDASFAIVFSTLTQGGRLALVPPGEELNPTALLELVAENRVTVLPATPRLLDLLVEHPRAPDQLKTLRQIQTGGESITLDLCQQITNRLKVPLVNLYGPTEAAIEATCWICRPGDQPPRILIGRPIANVRTYVLDAKQQPLPIGVPGELYIGGAGLARGYLNDPQRTAERFLPDPFLPDPLFPDRLSGEADSRVYRTGDRCRWLENGNLEFLGRCDQQVKLRGYRIELTEIEHLLTAHPGIRDAAVAVCADQAQEPQLVAYIVSHKETSGEATALNEEALRRDMRDMLPSYMVPALFEPLDELPRTASGKLDRASLPVPQQRVRARRSYVAPRTPLERFLVEASQKILQFEGVGIHDSFYELGGSSIQGATLLAMLQDELGERIQTAALFDLVEIGDLAAYLAKNHHETVVLRFGAQSSLPAGRSIDSSCDQDEANRKGGSSPNAPPGSPNDLIVPIQPNGDKTPLFMVHPPGGIVICYQPLAHHLGNDQPLYGIRARGLHGEPDLPGDMITMAALYVAAVRTVQPKGPYCLGGWSLGGVVAYEMAQQLTRAGETVRHLVLLDTTIPQGEANQKYLTEEENTGLEYGLDVTLDELAQLDSDQQLPYLWKHAKELGVLDEGAPESLVQQVLDDLGRLFHSHVQLASQYALVPYPGRITLMRPSDAPVEIVTTPERGWQQLASQVGVHFVPGQHHSMVKEPHVGVLARQLAECLGN